MNPWLVRRARSFAEDNRGRTVDIRDFRNWLEVRGFTREFPTKPEMAAVLRTVGRTVPTRRVGGAVQRYYLPR